MRCRLLSPLPLGEGEGEGGRSEGVRDVGFEDKPICGAGFYPLYLRERVRVREVGVKE